MSRSSLQPVLFSRRFNIPTSELDRLGVFDPTLNADTLLFPDPLLLERSEHAEMRAAKVTFDQYFEQVMKLLHGIRQDEDRVWKAAFKHLSFPEIKGTCLGYGSSISGSGTGPTMTTKLINSGREVIRMGIDDPDLFMAIGLFEEDFGPDLIGDMFTNIGFAEIAKFNQRIIDELDIPHKEFDIKLANGKRYKVKFAENLVIDKPDIPIILMPKDILRDLPIATCWSEVQSVAADNEEFRDSLNTSVANLWSKKTLESKGALKRWAMSSAQAFGSLLDMLHGHDGKPYDFIGDRNGELIWRSIGERIFQDYPFSISKPPIYNDESVIQVVEDILGQFIHLVEQRDLWREFYTDASYSQPRFEKSSQRLFYATALSYCKANNLDITPEADTGCGPVDFKFSQGIDRRILLEIKLSTNNHVVRGFEKQLKIYNNAEQPISSYYVVMDVGNLNQKWSDLQALQKSQIVAKGSAPNLILVNALPRVSASKAK